MICKKCKYKIAEKKLKDEVKKLEKSLELDEALEYLSKSLKQQGQSSLALDIDRSKKELDNIQKDVEVIKKQSSCHSCKNSFDFNKLISELPNKTKKFQLNLKRKLEKILKITKDPKIREFILNLLSAVVMALSLAQSVGALGGDNFDPERVKSPIRYEHQAEVPSMHDVTGRRIRLTVRL